MFEQSDCLLKCMLTVQPPHQLLFLMTKLKWKGCFRRHNQLCPVAVFGAEVAVTRSGECISPRFFTAVKKTRLKSCAQSLTQHGTNTTTPRCYNRLTPIPTAPPLAKPGEYKQNTSAAPERTLPVSVLLAQCMNAL